MDNVTHTLIGITFSKVLVSGKKQISGPEKQALFWTAVFGNNLPDIDSVWTFFRRNVDGNLSYLLEHRGYTHTLLGALPMGLLAAGIGCWIARIKLTRHFLISVVLCGFLSVLLHIGADTLNDYGVHPLSPFFNRWYYGDSVFILEPFLWMTMIPLTVASIQWKPGRWIWSMLGLGLLGVLWTSHFTPIFTAAAATVWGLSFSFMEKRKWGFGPVLVGLFLLIFGFSYSSHQAKMMIRNHFDRNVHGEILQEVITTPAPGNPFCWNAWLVTQSPNEFISKNVIVSLWPAHVDPVNCYPNRGNLRTAPLSPASNESSAALQWLGDYHLSRRTFQDWSWKNSCFRAFLAFSRLPFLAEVEGHWIAGDLRYDRGKGKGFAQVDLEREKECALLHPKWDPPFLRSISR